MTGTSGPSEDPSERVDELPAPVPEAAGPALVVALDDAMADPLASLSAEPLAFSEAADAATDVAFLGPDAAESVAG